MDQNIEKATNYPSHFRSESSLTSFHLFAALPSEIRLRIWELAASVPRNVDIWVHPLQNDNYEEFSILTGDRASPPFRPFRWRSNTPVPDVLHACQESRAAALRMYHLDFGYEEEFKHFTYSTLPKIYINPDADRVCIMDHPSIEEPDWGYPELLQKCAVNGTRRLAIRVDPYSAGYYAEVDAWLNPMLEEITFFAPLTTPLEYRTIETFQDETVISIDGWAFEPTLDRLGVQKRAVDRSYILQKIKVIEKSDENPPARTIKLAYVVQKPTDQFL